MPLQALLPSLVVAVLTLAACDASEPQTYPLSGETCSADDPVLDLDAGDCVVPTVG